MIDFLRPWAFLLLPLPLLLWRLLPPVTAHAAVIVPGRVNDLLTSLPDARDSSSSRQIYRIALAVAGWFFLVLALSAPLSKDEPLRAASGRDLLLAVDLSASMTVRDVMLDGQLVDRFSAVKALAAAFIRRREGDRVGLIVFADKTYLVAPLTFDVQAVSGFLDEVVVGLPGQRTAVGDAIGLSIKTLQQQPMASRVLILLSDGDSNAGLIVPKAAAQLAVKHQVRIHTIGFSSGGQPEAAQSSLARIAALTGGRHYVAPTTQALDTVYAELDRLEPTQSNAPGQFAERDWVQEALLAVMLVLAPLTFIEWRAGRL